MLGNFSCFLLSSADFFENKLFQNILSGTLTLSECQRVCILIRTDKTSVLIFCKVCQQITKVTTARKELILLISLHSTCRHVFSIKMESGVDPDHMA